MNFYGGVLFNAAIFLIVGSDPNDNSWQK